LLPSRNKATVLAEAMFQGGAEAITAELSDT
jgi:hypothetical protein